MDGDERNMGGDQTLLRATGAAASRHDFKPGEVIGGRYRLDHWIDRGGMSEVWLGHDLRLSRDVAVKVLPPGGADREDYALRLEREATTIAALRHPSIVDIYDFGRDAEGRPYLVMELLEGESLASLLLRVGPIGARRAIGLLLPIGRALIFAHRRGVVHRDLKPANMYVAQQADGVVAAKLLDFGIARRVGAGRPTTGGWLGTPDYMAPEQLDPGPSDAGQPDPGRAVTSAVDQWAFCASVYECAVGRPPFAAPSLGAAFEAIRRKPLPFPRNGAIDGRLFRVLARGTRKAPGDRYPDFAALLRDLCAAVGLESTAAMPSAAMPTAATPTAAMPSAATPPPPPSGAGDDPEILPHFDDAIRKAFGDGR